MTLFDTAPTRSLPFSTTARDDAQDGDRRPRRVRHELRLREVRVERVERIGASFVRIRFGGEALRDFTSLSFDDHVKFIFDDAQGRQQRRDYTPLAYNNAACTLDLEFALHVEGPASDWARDAHPGQHACIGGPKGSMIIPTGYDWHLLIGDASALPAITRRLAELPAGARTVALVQVDQAEDRRTFDTRADLTLHWLADTPALLQTLATLPRPEGEGFAWACGESSAMAQVRDQLWNDWQMPRDLTKVAAYWKQGATDFSERLTG